MVSSVLHIAVLSEYVKVLFSILGKDADLLFHRLSNNQRWNWEWLAKFIPSVIWAGLNFRKNKSSSAKSIVSVVNKPTGER